MVRKGIKNHAAKLYKGALVLQVLSFDGFMASLQFIQPDGRKTLLSGSQKKGCFIPVAGYTPKISRIIISEGWGTGCTLAEDDPKAMVLAAIDASNLIAVAVATRRLWPSAEIVIAGDDDRLTPGNPGATKARAAALAANAQLALPQWPEDAPETLTDFNDLALWLAGGAT